MGRIDDNKGCRQLFDFFRRYRAQTGSGLRLALIGKPVLPIPQDPGIVHLGFLPDQEKWDALAACELLIMPSRLESLSMVSLEAWWAERPVLANAKCDVLRGQCQRSNAGLYYASYEEFREALALLESDAGAARRRLARTGAATSTPTTPGRRSSGSICACWSSCGGRTRLPLGAASAGLARNGAVKPAVHQLLAALSYGDAIGNEALAIQARLRAAG